MHRSALRRVAIIGDRAYDCRHPVNFATDALLADVLAIAAFDTVTRLAVSGGRLTMMKTYCVGSLALLLSGGAYAGQPAPAWLHEQQVAHYDGKTDDLVTAGLGAEAMTGAPPSFADALHPTAQELRRAAIFFRASKGQGYGRLFGPNVDQETGKLLDDGGKIAGDEILAFADDRDGKQNVAMLLQIPENLATDRRCLIAIPVNGSSSLFRDVVDFGYWGLRHRCAVVYNDKGHGNGFHLLETDSVNLIDGRQVPAPDAGSGAHFRADLDDPARSSFLAAWPHRVAFKAAHSKQNPEKDWGTDLLRSVEFAFFELAKRDPGFIRENTIVIATGSSNGGGAVLYGAEKDEQHLLDGVVAREPQVQLKPDDRVVVTRGSTERRGTGRTLLDYFSFGNLYQPCAVLAVPDIPLKDRVPYAANRCQSLHDKGLLTATTLDGQAQEALDRMHAYGWNGETDVGHAFGYFVAPDATATKYVNDHGRFDVRDRVCGYSYAATDADGRLVAVPPALAATIFSVAPGGAPAGAIDVINDNDPTGPRRSWLSVSPSTGRQDFDLDGAVCIRDLVTGSSPDAKRVKAGIDEFLASGHLHGLPTIIVHGRSDDRVPAGFSSRPYLGLNSLIDGDNSNLRYIEVTNAEHFGTDLPGFDTRMIPLTLYHLRALDQMWAHLTSKAALPPSQIVRTTPRGGEPGKAPPLQSSNVPSISASPSEADKISVEKGRVRMPD
ncbi:D-(-)-3-hydroxybutyrate oligomer hydrolase precursor (3HB-oligomer hydrolase) (3HBOH) [Bradyrhizobium sp. STM 3843]|uniref:3-hydroxybutyrate oligomer hydrolase family protein n=1 Tax=Bradyrhizobium sp. STM 3843 TaxID=551947 RepID=UPI0002403A50|nr:3-hydroxybutyrate oligomer hydrolase family protein [Bradyrhizobium sp. STM 3843]CCE09081.1 D-(-)-3-hydroxybutyrate oligomer hydrolase precursor (3HB-oligomer hydrolase) (3HBOH) [Bradyrhizobium sp. STM 3843]